MQVALLLAEHLTLPLEPAEPLGSTGTPGLPTMQTVATNMLIDLGGCLSKLDFGWQIRTLPGTALSWPERLSLGSAGRDKKKKKKTFHLQACWIILRKTAAKSPCNTHLQNPLGSRQHIGHMLLPALALYVQNILLRGVQAVSCCLLAAQRSHRPVCQERPPGRGSPPLMLL